jgi:(methylthio)acryloyl-CoA hydratase
MPTLNSSQNVSTQLMGENQEIAIIKMMRASKRNAINDSLMFALREAVEALPANVGAAVLTGDGDHFSAGLDLSELQERDAGQGLMHSRSWHSALDAIQFGRVPVIAALHGAVVGGGLELASTCHIRVADESTFYALPEGSRGIFVGGGGSVRIPKLIGAARMADMMFTGRVYSGAEGEKVGFAQYLVAKGEALNKAIEIATRVAQNAPLTNYALMHALPRIAEQASDHGYLAESMMAAIAQSAPEAKARVKAFLDGKAAKVQAK